MAKNLVIVESPAKAGTIQKFLGSNYTVIASGGHVRDLPKSTLGIDVNGTYEPKYITIRGKGDQLSMMRKEVKKASKIYLATDPDREGEAISWHLYEVLKLKDKKCYRITFNEITKNAVKSSLSNAREIDMNLVNSQQARRVLDRLVGYSISPLLWKKVKSGTSAGRVQSVVLRLIADREESIADFNPVEYWNISAVLGSGKKIIEAPLSGYKGKKLEISSKAEADEVLEKLNNAEFVVSDVKLGEKVRKAPLPFTTSTLQQEASKALGYSTVKTMRIAQQLYEGVSVKGHGMLGLITYLRTDSTRISEEARENAKNYISSNYGDNYIGEIKSTDKEKKIQDAHEAIRPTYIDLTPASVKDDLSKEQFRLYQLIWKRFIAANMCSSVFEYASVTITAAEYDFKTTSSKVKFEGYTTVYREADLDEEKNTKNLFIPEVSEKLILKETSSSQHFTKPPAHYTEASMVKVMEELGIGRPSTYAPTIATLLARHYITKEGKNLYISEMGEAVNSIMKKSFPSIVDINFTSNMETLLDGVEEGTVNWKNIVANFYPDLEALVKIAMEETEKLEIHDEVTDIKCDECGQNMVIKFGPYGKFLACPAFPKCKGTKNYFEKTEYKCPKCGSNVILRRTRKGRRYYGCENYNECDFMSWQKPGQTVKSELRGE